MKTTLNIHDALLAQAKALAVQQHSTLTRLIEEGLRMRLRATETVLISKRRAMPVVNGKKGLALGLGGLSTREMLDAADHAA
jgi:F420-0:gamma-glutamyl ligase